jgi:hypothetical protein
MIKFMNIISFELPASRGGVDPYPIARWGTRTGVTYYPWQLHCYNDIHLFG